jgi:ParB family chromosome partitioning protein
MSQSERQTVELVSLDRIVPLPGNMTVIGREEDLMLRTDMTRIELDGLYKIDPILLRRLKPEEIEEIKAKEPWSQACYQIIDGHSRWEAARELGWHRIRAIIIDCTREEAYAINYMKNKARGRVDPLREAMYFRHLHEDLKMTQEKIAEKFGIDRSYVAKILKRIKVGKEARRRIVTRVTKPLSGKHLEVIASLPEEKQVELTDAIIEGKLSWREAEKAKEAVEKGLPKEEAVKTAKAPTPPIEKIKIGEIECPKCHETYRILHVDGKHKLERVD